MPIDLSLQDSLIVVVFPIWVYVHCCETPARATRTPHEHFPCCRHFVSKKRNLCWSLLEMREPLGKNSIENPTDPIEESSMSGQWGLKRQPNRERRNPLQLSDAWCIEHCSWLFNKSQLEIDFFWLLKWIWVRCNTLLCGILFAHYFLSTEIL